MGQDQLECIDDALVRTRQQEMITSELEKGRTRTEIIALYGLTDDIFARLEQDETAKTSFRRAETSAFLADLDFLRSNLDSKTINGPVCALYFANRYGWSAKPNKLNKSKPLTSTDAIVDAALAGDIDGELALTIIKTAALNAEIKQKADVHASLLPKLELLEKFMRGGSNES